MEGKRLQASKMPRSIEPGKLILIGLAVLIGILVVADAFTVIDAGTVGVVKKFGRVTGRILDQGMHLIVPVADKVMVYNTKDIVYEATPGEKQAGSNADYLDYPIDTTTQDGQQIDLSYSIRFRVKRAEAPRIAQELGDEAAVVEKVVRFYSRIFTREIPRSYKASELYTGDITVVREVITDKLRPLFEEDGLALEAFGIREITFSPDYVAAIEQKQIEKEKVVTEEYRAQQAKHRKQASITEAEGEAQAIRVKGEALKENPDMVQLEFVRSLRDPDSRVKVMVIPSEGVLPWLNLDAIAGE